MSEFNVGDLVEARRGETLLRSRVEMRADAPYLGDPNSMGYFLHRLREVGFTLSLVEAATPPLPTEPGIYRDKWAEHWSLHENGQWFSHGDGSLADTPVEEAVQNCAPFTRLEPVPVTAKKVLADVWEWYQTKTNLQTYLHGLETKYGVEL